MNKNIYLAMDIDGTIYDAGDILEESFSDGIESCIKSGRVPDLNFPSKEDIVKTLGLTLSEIFIQLFPSLEKDNRDELSSICTGNLVNMIRARRGLLIEGVEETVPELSESGYHMLVASNGVKSYVEAILETYDLRKFFSPPFVYPEGEIDDKTGVVEFYCSNLKDADLIIMVGDRFTDLEAARENNIPFIGCAFGHAGTAEMEGEKYIIHSFDELPAMVRRVAEDALAGVKQGM